MQPPVVKLDMKAPIEPVHDMISSERYIEALERKLNKVKGKQAKEPTAKDMLSALEKVKEDQMHHLIDSSQQETVQENQCLEGAVMNKGHSGKQHNVEEIVAIIYQDVLSKETDENDPSKFK